MIDFYSTEGHDKLEYEKSHGARFDYFVKRFALDKILNKKILDVGCGLGFIFDRIDTRNNSCVGIDYSVNNQPKRYSHYQVDLNIPFAEVLTKQCDKSFDFIICSETLEHLQNPYNCLFEIKKLMQEHTMFYLTIPAESTKHNTLYPGLFYPSENFDEFLKQMAFSIENKENHSAAFEQVVYTLKSLPWKGNNLRMRFINEVDSRQFDVPPHVSINL